MKTLFLSLFMVVLMAMPSMTSAQHPFAPNTVYFVDMQWPSDPVVGKYWELKVTFGDTIITPATDTIITLSHPNYSHPFDVALDTTFISGNKFYARYALSGIAVGVGWNDGQLFDLMGCNGAGHCTGDSVLTLHLRAVDPQYRPQGSLNYAVGSFWSDGIADAYTLMSIKVPLCDFYTNPLHYPTPLDSTAHDTTLYTIVIHQDTTGIDTIVNIVTDPISGEIMSIDTSYAPHVEVWSDTTQVLDTIYHTYTYQPKPLTYSVRMDEYPSMLPMGSVIYAQGDTLYCYFDEYLQYSSHEFMFLLITENDSTAIPTPLRVAYAQNNAAYIDTVEFQQMASPGDTLHIRFTAGDTLLVPQDTALMLNVTGPSWVSWEYTGYPVLPPTKAAGDTIWVRAAMGTGVVPEDSVAKSVIAHYIFTVSTTDWTGHTSEPQTYTLTVVDTLLLVEDFVFGNAGIQIFPNPTTEYLKVSGVINAVGITDMQGKLVLSQDCTTTTDVNVSALKPGLYLIHVQTSSGIIVKKFLKQ